MALFIKRNKDRKMSEVLHSSDATFVADVVNSDVPVLLDFWAPWCGPCKMIAPILDDLAVEFAGKVKIVKINIDDNQATPAQFGVRSIPTLLLFKDGKPVATQVGALPKNQLAAFINQNI
jgi:thioredoxin